MVLFRENLAHLKISKMPLSKLSGITLPATFDAHVHLRDGAMMELVVPTIRRGGVDTGMKSLSIWGGRC